MAMETLTREEVLSGLRIIIDECANHRRLLRKLIVIWLGVIWLICCPIMIVQFNTTGEMSPIPILVPAILLIVGFVGWNRKGVAADRRIAPVAKALFRSIPDYPAYRRWLKNMTKAEGDALLQAYFDPNAPFTPTINRHFEANESEYVNRI